MKSLVLSPFIPEWSDRRQVKAFSKYTVSRTTDVQLKYQFFFLLYDLYLPLVGQVGKQNK